MKKESGEKPQGTFPSFAAKGGASGGGHGTETLRARFGSYTTTSASLLTWMVPLRGYAQTGAPGSRR